VNRDVRFSAQELTVTVGGVLKRVDLGRSQPAVGLHIEADAPRSNRAADGRNELAVDERHPDGRFA
jgi:hypothetical protein